MTDEVKKAIIAHDAKLRVRMEALKKNGKLSKLQETYNSGVEDC
jgi:hypothetical protein